MNRTQLLKSELRIMLKSLTMELKSVDSYRANLRSAARGLWNGSFSQGDFEAEMVLVVTRGFREAWIEGAAQQGIKFSELTRTERTRLIAETENELGYAGGLSDFIYKYRKEEGGLLRTVFARVEQWVDGYTRIRNLADALAAKDKKKKWTLHPAEHCKSCLKLSGKVKRASFWMARNVYPKAWDKLKCKRGCKCTFEDTDEPLTRGPLPNLP